MIEIRNRLRSPVFQTVGIAALAIGLLYFFFRGADPSAILTSLAGADPLLICLAVATMAVTYWIRAIRWKLLLRPLGRAGLVNCFVTTVIGFMFNFLAARLGEIVRPYLLARRESLSPSSTFATIIIERVMDLVAVLLLIGFWLLFGGEPDGIAGREAVNSLQTGGLIGLAGAILAIGTMFVFARFPQRALGRLKQMFRGFPKRPVALVMRFLETFSEGLRVLVDSSSLIKAVAWSILLWINISLAFWLGAIALEVTFPFGATFLVIGFLTVGVALPTPGGIGGYHVMCALALTMLFRVDDSLARSVSLVNHAIAFVPVTVLGLVLFAREGLSFRQLKNISSSS